MPAKKTTRPVVTKGEEDVFYELELKGQKTLAQVMRRREDKVYIHYVGRDKRLDFWTSESRLPEPMQGDVVPPISRKRKRVSSVSVSAIASGSGLQVNEATPPIQTQAPMSVSAPPVHRHSERPNGQTETRPPTELTEEEIDVREHRKITSKRNFDKVNFGRWQIKTWYFSPYPLSSAEEEEMVSTSASHKPPPTKIHNVSRASVRAHGRTSDILAGGMMRDATTGDKPILWVCDRCFKYMREGSLLELHSKTCLATHPPGRKVYQRGAHVIWEVDGAKDKLFCQNLSLFGKLFIDIKTLFFDTEGFYFYLLTEGEPQRDHVIGFFSKEKVSYDEYNLATIVVFPPYQRRRYGMLMIEFSYELSRRVGKTGTPERPLSDLGLRSFLTYWIATLVQFFRRLLSIRPGYDTRSSLSSPDDEDLLTFVESGVNGLSRARKRKGNAWEAGAEMNYHNRDAVAATCGDNDAVFSKMRHLRLTANADGSTRLDVFVKCTLEDISKATGLRMEDVAFTLHECGLLQRRTALESKEVFVLSREMVERVADERKVKKMCMEVQYVLL